MINMVKSLFSKKEITENELTHIDTYLEEKKKELSIHLAQEEAQKLLIREEAELFLSMGMQKLYSSFYDELITMATMPKVFADFNNKLSKNISHIDILDIFMTLISEARNCSTFSKLNSTFTADHKKKFYITYFEYISYRAADTLNIYKTLDSFLFAQKLDVFSRAFCDEGDTLASKTVVHDLIDGRYTLDMLNKALDDYTFQNQNTQLDDVEKATIYLNYQGSVFNHTLYYLYGMTRFVISSHYVESILKNEELVTLINNALEKYGFYASQETLFNIYKEFYSDIFSDTLSNEDFSLVLAVYYKTIFKNISLERHKATIELLGVDYEKLATRFLESDYTNISDFIISVLGEDEFSNLMTHHNYQSFIRIFQILLCSEVIGKAPFTQWLSTLGSIEELSQKIEIYHQKQQLLDQDTAKLDTLRNLKNLYNNIKTADEFEILLEQLSHLMGYTVSLPPKTGHQGADLILEKSNQKILMQANFVTSPVNNNAILDLSASVAYYGADTGIAVTNHSFAKSALALAQASGITVIDGSDLVNSINSFL